MSETITKYYSLGNALMQYGQVNGENNPNATTMQAMQAYMKQNGDTLGNVVESFLWQPETDYVINAEVHSPNLPAGYIARCTTAGKTGSIEPEWSTSYSTCNDGTVTWSIISLKEQILQNTTAIAGKADKATTLEGYGITDAISQDDVLTLEEIEASTELADTDVASASALKSLELVPKRFVIGNGAYVVKYGNVAMLSLESSSQFTVAEGGNIFGSTILPEEYRPTRNISFAESESKTRIGITPSGEVKSIPAITNKFLRGIITYIVKE